MIYDLMKYPPVIPAPSLEGAFARFHIHRKVFQKPDDQVWSSLCPTGRIDQRTPAVEDAPYPLSPNPASRARTMA